MKRIFATLALLAIMLPTVVLAQSAGSNTTGGTGGNGGGTATNITLDNPLGNVNTPQKLIGQIINSVLGLVGSIALLMFIWGGFQWMTAAGSSEKVEKGKKTLMWAALGMVVIFSSYALVTYVIKNVIGAK